jgi:hypothetical protein
MDDDAFLAAFNADPSLGGYSRICISKKLFLTTILQYKGTISPI